jgi:hypothetical protein
MKTKSKTQAENMRHLLDALHACDTSMAAHDGETLRQMWASATTDELMWAAYQLGGNELYWALQGFVPGATMYADTSCADIADADYIRSLLPTPTTADVRQCVRFNCTYGVKRPWELTAEGEAALASRRREWPKLP